MFFPDYGKRFGAIYSDNPWDFLTRSSKGRVRSAERHYPVMSIAEIMAMPVAAELAADDCVLFMWVPMPHLRLGLGVIDAWGFDYKTCGFSWIKLNADGTPFRGMGFWTRANAEICLLATRGHPKRLNADVAQAILAQRGRHSAKPPEIRDRIRRLVAGPYIELFAREETPGWTAWGNEVPS